jgi:lactoylglutathione lyase
MENLMIGIPPKNTTGINGKMKAGHIGLRTTEFEQTIQWYQEKLGFRLLKKWEAGELKLAFLAPANDDHFWIEVLSGGIAGSHQDPTQPIISGFQHLCFDVENVDETLSALRERDVPTSREPFNSPAIGRRCGFINDLHGNAIEFTAEIK